MKIKFLGTHNAESITTRLVTFVVDDVLAIESGSLTIGLSLAQQKKIKAILLSHGHYDHIRDIPLVAFNNADDMEKPPIDVFGNKKTLEILQSHLINGTIYPNFANDDSYLGKPILNLKTMVVGTRQYIAGFQVRALPVNHPLEGIGFEIISPEGKSLFYTGDTGPSLTALWPLITPQILIIETTLPNRLSKTARLACHLCPATLKQELLEFQKIKGYLPDIRLVHISPEYESEIHDEVKSIKNDMQISIKIVVEGDEISL